MISISSNKNYSAILVPLSAAYPKYHNSACCRTLGYFFWAFCLILTLGLKLDFGQPLEDSSNHTQPLTTPSLMLLPLINTTDVILAITLPKWTNKNDGFTYLISGKPNFCRKPQKVFFLCKTSFCQCILLKWTNTFAPVCIIGSLALSLPSITAPITTAVHIKRPFDLPPF
jgi:hypothetical protein